MRTVKHTAKGARTLQKFSLWLDTKEEAEAATDLLWNKLGVRGEIAMIPLEGKFKLDVITEKDLTAQQMEKLPGKRS